MTPEEKQVPEQWEMYCDESYYGLWAVRPIGDRDFNSTNLFHLHSEAQAFMLKQKLESLESSVRELEESRDSLSEMSESLAHKALLWASVHFTILGSDLWQDDNTGTRYTTSELLSIYKERK